MSGRDIKAFAARHLADQGQAVLRHRTEAGLPRDDAVRAERRRQSFAHGLEPRDRLRLRRHRGGVERQRHDIGQRADMRRAVGARKHLDRDPGAPLVVIVEEQRVRGNVVAGVVDDARTALSVDRGQAHPFGREHRPRTHRDHHVIGLDHFAVDLDAARRRAMRVPDDAGDAAVAQRGAMRLRGAHHARSEFPGMHDRRRP